MSKLLTLLDEFEQALRAEECAHILDRISWSEYIERKKETDELREKFTH